MIYRRSKMKIVILWELFLYVRPPWSSANPCRVVYNFQVINQNLNPISRSIRNLSSYNELGHSKVLTIVRSSSYQLARLLTSSISIQSMQPYMCLDFLLSSIYGYGMTFRLKLDWFWFRSNRSESNSNESDWIEEVMKWQCNHKRQEQTKEI